MSTVEVRDVVVVGGGFAGVTAARELAGRGNDVLLLEARDRLGGRTHSQTWHGEMIELGGAWVHHLQPFVWSEIQRAGQTVRACRKADSSWFSDGTGPRPTTAAEQLELAEAWERFLEPTKRAIPQPHLPMAGALAETIDRQTMAERLADLQLDDHVYARLTATLTSWANGSIDRAGALFCHRLYALSGFSLGVLEAISYEYVLAGGTGHLVDEIAAQASFDLHLATTVTSITHGTDLVHVATADGAEFAARAAVIAVPLNVLNEIAFVPPLSPGKQAAIAEKQVSTGFKMLIKARGGEDRIETSGISTVFVHVLTDRILADGSQLLVGFGPDSRQVSGATIAEVNEAVSAVVPGVVVEDFVWHDWTEDALSHGTWAVHAPRWATKHAAELAAPAGQLAFAGADMACGWVGHIDGAIETGVRAGREIRRYLANPSAMTRGLGGRR